MKKCYICGKEIESGYIVDKQCLDKLVEEADDNAALAMQAKMNLDDLQKKYDDLNNFEHSQYAKLLLENKQLKEQLAGKTKLEGEE